MSSPVFPIKETYLTGSYPYARAGDVFLIEPPATAKSGSISIQRMLRMTTRVRFSHVAVALNTVHVIHAMPGSGVHISKMHEFISEQSIHSGQIQVFRHQLIDQSMELTNLLEEQLWIYFNQPYFHPLLRFGDRSSYCSELAAKAYSKVGIKLTKVSSRRTLPLDIERAVSEPQWTNVSVQYLLPVVEPDITSLVGKATVDMAKLKADMSHITALQDELHAGLIRLEADMERKFKQVEREERFRKLFSLMKLRRMSGK